MRILCDQHVASKHRQALEGESWITVATVRDVLAHDAPDGAISAHAAANDWVVLTNDTDFYRQEHDHGLLVYGQVDDPLPGEVVDAIAGAYGSNAEIDEVVPDGWI